MSIQIRYSGTADRGACTASTGRVGLVVADEAHHSTGSWMAVIRYYLCNPACRLLGVTAAADRNDDRHLTRYTRARLSLPAARRHRRRLPARCEPVASSVSCHLPIPLNLSRCPENPGSGKDRLGTGAGRLIGGLPRPAHYAGPSRSLSASNRCRCEGITDPRTAGRSLYLRWGRPSPSRR